MANTITNKSLTTNEDLVEVLNDLILINNDRIEGYEKAAKETDFVDVDLQTIFHRMANESRQYVSELTQKISSLGGQPADGTTTKGKIYRVWMDVKATFTGSDRESILNSCEFGEDAAQKAYNEALEADATRDIDTRQMITRQKAALHESHDLIKEYRDANKQ